VTGLRPISAPHPFTLADRSGPLCKVLDYGKRWPRWQLGPWQEAGWSAV